MSKKETWTKEFVIHSPDYRLLLESINIHKSQIKSNKQFSKEQSDKLKDLHTLENDLIRQSIFNDPMYRSDKDKFIKFDVIQSPDKNHKTYIVNVVTNSLPKLVLGTIKWYGAWRKYSFFPAHNTLFEPICMGDISMYMKKLMEERRQNKP